MPRLSLWCLLGRYLRQEGLASRARQSDSAATLERNSTLVASEVRSKPLTVSYKSLKSYVAFMRLIRWREFYLHFLTSLFH